MTPEIWTEIETAVHAWIVRCSGLDAEKVIFSHQNAPNPTGNYITITLALDAGTVGMAPESGSDEDGNPTETAQWRFEGVIEAYRDGCFALLMATKSKMFLPSYYTPLEDSEVSAQINGDILHLPTMPNQAWEEHAKLDILFHAGGIVTTDTGEGSEPVGWFNKVSFSMDEPDRPVPPTTITGDE